ncbi:MAG: 2-C-methyl-D-erythritol 4-phosphate cytidylyltransferase [Butyrivibrio sp.]|nr:2-C-methyl-D-erythritol 4-phosphate cytidylyltransferase [Butyrivibrio sp.]
MNIALIFAGGNGERMRNSIPKQFIEVKGKSILIYTLQIFQKNNLIDFIYLAVPEKYIEKAECWAEQYSLDKVKNIISGGASAQETIYRLLLEVDKDFKDNPIVVLHDGVRPIVTQETINKNIQCVRDNGNAVSVTPCYETIVVNDKEQGIMDVPYRVRTFAAQAPQSFYLNDILSAHREIQAQNGGYENMIDACTIYHELGRKVELVEGNRGNIKITTPEDIYMFEALLEHMPEIWSRNGQDFS